MQMEITFEGKRSVVASFDGYRVVTDQPVRAGGDGIAPTPFDTFLASLGTCAGIYVKSFCDQRGISTENIKLVQSLEYNPETRMIGKIIIDIKLPPDFPEQYKSAVINAAALCAVKKHMQNPPDFDIITSVI